MTCIAWDGETLAADKMAVMGGGIKRTVTKIERYDCGDGHVSLLGITGDWDSAVEMREWWKAGAEPLEFPESARKGEATLIVIDSTGLLSYGAGPYPVPYEDAKAAFGSGRDFAEAAMYLGKSAAVAVAAAAHFQNDVGNGIDKLTLT